MIVDNDLLSIQQARVLAENAFIAQKKLSEFDQDKLDYIVEQLANKLQVECKNLAFLSHEETGYGVWQDKWIKNLFVCKNIANHLRGMKCVGVINEDKQNKIVDVGIPVGVIVALCPSTSPISTAIYKTLLAIKTGNSIIFSPHPKALKAMSTALDIMIRICEEAGLPKGCLSYLQTVAKPGTLELMKHPYTSLLLVTGITSMRSMALNSGKTVLYGGTGNGPAFIERTADINKAVKDIIRSKTFDNAIAPSAEQSVVVDGSISSSVKAAFQEQGAYFMSEEESLKLGKLFFCATGKRIPRTIGISAILLAQKAGFKVPSNTKILMAERKYVSENDPYAKELLAPVLAYYVEDDWEHACEKCIELLLHERNSHTLVIHSNDEYVIRQFALKKPVGRIIVNTSSAFGGIGATTNLFPSMMLGSGSSGFGVTAENVSPQNLIYVRKVGYGVRDVEEVTNNILGTNIPIGTHCEFDVNGNTKMRDILHRIMIEAIEVIDKPTR